MLMIAKEGNIILIPSILLSLVITLIYGLGFTTIFLWLFVIFSLYFFRDPIRIIKAKSNQMVSPADGKIVQIINTIDDNMGECKLISIYLNLFNVHRQRVPLTGKVISYFYNPGKFHLAFKDKASMYNEQTTTMFETDKGNTYKVKQIAGALARRIVNYMTPNKKVNRGQKFGFIRFGSRVDIIVPYDFKIDVKVGDKVKNNINIIGTFK